MKRYTYRGQALPRGTYYADGARIWILYHDMTEADAVEIIYPPQGPGVKSGGRAATQARAHIRRQLGLPAPRAGNNCA